MLADWQCGFRVSPYGNHLESINDQWTFNGVCDVHKADLDIDVLIPPGLRQRYLENLYTAGFEVPDYVEFNMIFVILVAGSS